MTDEKSKNFNGNFMNNILNIINDFDDFEPEENNKYLKCSNLPEVDFKITQQLIDEAKEHIEYKEMMGVQTEYEKQTNYIYKIYKFYDENNSVTTFTTMSLETALKNNIVGYLEKKNTSRLINFMSLTNVKMKLLGVYKKEDGSNIDVKILNELKNKFMEENNTITENNGNILKIYKNEIANIVTNIQNENIKSKEYNIYRIYNVNNKEQQYIFGQYNEANFNDINKIVKNNHLKFDSNELEMDLIEEKMIKLKIEGLICVDGHISKNNSIKKGLNKCFNLINPKSLVEMVKKKLFILAQLDIANQLTNNEVVSECYIACIENQNHDRYIFYENNSKTLKQKIVGFYLDILKNPSNNWDLLGLLCNDLYEKLCVYVLESNIAKEEIDEKYTFWKAQYGTENLFEKMMIRTLPKTINIVGKGGKLMTIQNPKLKEYIK